MPNKETKTNSPIGPAQPVTWSPDYKSGNPHIGRSLDVKHMAETGEVREDYAAVIGERDALVAEVERLRALICLLPCRQRERRARRDEAERPDQQRASRRSGPVATMPERIETIRPLCDCDICGEPIDGKKERVEGGLVVHWNRDDCAVALTKEVERLRRLKGWRVRYEYQASTGEWAWMVYGTSDNLLGKKRAFDAAARFREAPQDRYRGVRVMRVYRRAKR